MAYHCWQRTLPMQIHHQVICVQFGKIAISFKPSLQFSSKISTVFSNQFSTHKQFANSLQNYLSQIYLLILRSQIDSNFYPPQFNFMNIIPIGNYLNLTNIIPHYCIFQSIHELLSYFIIKYKKKKSSKISPNGCVSPVSF